MSLLMAICFVEFWIQSCVLFSQKITEGLFECRLLLTSGNGCDGLTDGSMAAMTPWRPPRDLQLKKTWLRNLYKWISVPRRRELLHVLLWNYFESAKLGRCKFKRRVTWNDKAWHTAAAAAAHGMQANRQTDRQDKRKKVEKQGSQLENMLTTTAVAN